MTMTFLRSLPCRTWRGCVRRHWTSPFRHRRGSLFFSANTVFSLMLWFTDGSSFTWGHRRKPEVWQGRGRISKRTVRQA